MYVAQARNEGINAEEAFLQVFLDKCVERFPEEASRLQDENAMRRHSYENELALELGWADSDCVGVCPNHHWRAVFRIGVDDWEEEAAKFCSYSA